MELAEGFEPIDLMITNQLLFLAELCQQNNPFIYSDVTPKKLHTHMQESQSYNPFKYAAAP